VERCELLTCLIKDLNLVFFTGLDENSGSLYGRSAACPMAKEKQEKKKASTDVTLNVGGSNAMMTVDALANLGIDSFKLTTLGWKLNKEKRKLFRT
jgi:hypothetical protein